MRMICCLIAVVFTASCAAQNSTEGFRNRVTLLKRFMDKNHYQPRKWNDSTSAVLYDHWIEKLDENKIYFLQKDIDRLAGFKASSSMVNAKQPDFFSLSTGIYFERMMKADSSMSMLLAKPFDYTAPDSVVFPEKTYAADEKELDRRRSRYLKWHVLDNIADLIDTGGTISPKLPSDFAKKEKDERKRTLKKETYSFSLIKSDKGEFISAMQNAFLDAIAWTYDPHSNYMSLKGKRAFDAEVSAKEFSSGFTLEENEKGEKIIDYLQPGGSAWNSGRINTGDELIKIKTDKREYVAADMSDEQLEQILGSSGAIEITVKSASGTSATVSLAKDEVTDEDETVKSYLLKGERTYGYIDLPGFYSREEDANNLTYEGCAKDVSKELIKLKKDNISGLILDLRNNGGGSMWEAVQLAGIFIDAGTIASVKEKDGKVNMLKDPNRGTLYDGPMIVMVNGASASASEFFSAAMQDYNRALIVGGSTYGKGTAQVILPLDTLQISSSSSATEFVKVTVEKFYRVNGATVQWTGVVPDVSLPDLYGAGIEKENANASALVPDKSREGYYNVLKPFPLTALQSKSKARIDSDRYFQSVNSSKSVLENYKRGITIPLTWARYTAWRKIVFVNNEKKLSAEAASTGIKAENNSFDKQKRLAPRAALTNEEILKLISGDNELGESCKILNDLISGN